MSEQWLYDVSVRVASDTVLLMIGASIGAAVGYLRGIWVARKRSEVIEVDTVDFAATVNAVSVVNSDLKVHTPWYVRLERWILNWFK